MLDKRSLAPIRPPGHPANPLRYKGFFVGLAGIEPATEGL